MCSFLILKQSIFVLLCAPRARRIVALPALAAFYCMWVIAMVLRPVIILCLACLLWNAPYTIVKARMLWESVLYMVVCKDKSYDLPDDPANHMAQFKQAPERKTVVFIRHGESCWNDTFNAGGERQAAGGSSFSFVIIIFIAVLIIAVLNLANHQSVRNSTLSLASFPAS